MAAALKRMLLVGMKAENCLLRYRALKAHLTSSSSPSKELLKKEHEAADFHDDWECTMAEFRKKMKSDMAKHFATVEKINRDTIDYYISVNEARKKEQRKLLIVFAVIINAIFVAAAVGESYQLKKRTKRVHGRSP